MNATASLPKELSRAQLEERKESRDLIKVIAGVLVYAIICGTLTTLYGLATFKRVIGVHDLGLAIWSWLGIHTVLFVIGAVMGILIPFFIILGLIAYTIASIQR